MDESALTKTIEYLQRLSSSLDPAQRHFVVALSGGVDSTLLLLAAHRFCAQSNRTLSALHVHHGLSNNADGWLKHCQRLCDSLNITLDHQHVTIKAQARQSLEAQARDARYAVLLAYCRAHHGALLLGHHVQDQLETLLLQLKRGAGPKGLAGMGEVQQRDGVTLLRPMLSLEKSAIEEAVKAENVDWITDESNNCDDFDRNFLRNQIIPALTARWPQFAATASRSAKLCAEQDALLEEEARSRLGAISGPQGELPLAGLRQQPEGWQRAILRAWLTGQGIALPSYAQLEQIRDIQHARHDAQPQVAFGGYSIRRFDDALFAVATTGPSPVASLQLAINSYVSLPWLHIRIKLGCDTNLAEKYQWSLRTGMPSVRIKPEGQQVSKPLKQWLKLWKIPVWERSGVAVVFRDEEPVAIITRDANILLHTVADTPTIHRKAL